jgi:hypothetical protein
MKHKKESHTSSSNSNNTDRGDWHVSHTSMGMGNYYGQGIRNPVGRIRSGSGQIEVTPEKLKTPPKSLA